MSEQRLRAIVHLAGALMENWRAYEGTEATLSRPILSATGREPSRGGDHPDPTAGVALSHQPYWTVIECLDRALAHMRQVQQRMDQVRHHHPTIAREVDRALKQARCSGEIDPMCTDNAVRKGLCWRCYRAKQNAS